jgi:hypothetical protein
MPDMAFQAMPPTWRIEAVLKSHQMASACIGSRPMTHSE